MTAWWAASHQARSSTGRRNEPEANERTTFPTAVKIGAAFCKISGSVPPPIAIPGNKLIFGMFTGGLAVLGTAFAAYVLLNAP